MAEADPLQGLIAEQVAYYRASAATGDFGKTPVPGLPVSDLERAMEQMLSALDRFDPSGDVLELACGTGNWTGELLRHADSLTALDAAPEMLALSRERLFDERVRFIHADLFGWEPDRRYDSVFFGFWLSHVPIERFTGFWSLIDRCLKPGGRFAFVDDAYRTSDELIEGERSSTIRRRLTDGREFRIVKVPHTLDGLKEAIEVLGWEVQLRQLSGPFFWGEGRRSR